MGLSATPAITTGSHKKIQGNDMTQRSFGLDAIRAMACAMVVAFHASTTATQEKYFGRQTYDWLFNVENIRMPLFFVLSGYLMSTLYLNGNRGGGFAFLMKRFKKIFPLYWIALAVMTVATALVVGTVPIDGLAVAVKTVLLVPQSPGDVGGSGAPIIYPAWVLQYEMVGYGLVALAMLSRFLLGIFLWFWPVVHLMWAGSDVWWLSFIGSRWLLIFWFGIALGQYFSILDVPRKIAMAWFVAWSVFAVWANHADHISIASEALILGVAFCGLILAVRTIRYSDVPSWLGQFVKTCSNASYATFLFHIAVVSVVCRAVVGVGIKGAPGHLVSVLACTLGAVMLGVLIHRHVETRIAQALDRRRPETVGTSRAHQA